MLKLIIKLPETTDAKLLMTTALALAHYKTHKYHDFKLDTPNCYIDYENVDLLSFEPEKVYGSCDTCYWYEDYKSGMQEYELDAAVLDPYLVETLFELKKLVPFEMYFEQRGKYDPADWMYDHPEWLGDIEDPALFRLFYSEKSA